MKTKPHTHIKRVCELSEDRNENPWHYEYHHHIVTKLGVKLSTKDGDIFIFATLREQRPTNIGYEHGKYDAKPKSWRKLITKDFPLNEICVAPQCYFEYSEISLELEKDEIAKQIREQVLQLVVQLKVSKEN